MTAETGILPPRYRGARRIGRGGMGEIYRATDDVLGRDVAIKLLAGRYASDEAVRARFTREAFAAARLSGHPNIVTTFDVGEHDERPFIVMEYLAGGSLEDRVRDEGSRDPARTLACLEEAADALDYAHEQGIVHRDVKPANLLLDTDGHVHVADFGIASAAGLDSLTMTGTVLGTAAYLSPEQAQGERATPASDRYALAVVAYELLVGERPFAGDTPAAEAMAHVNAPVPPVTARRQDLPRELDAVFERALAKRPEDRYPSCGDFVAALRHALYASSPPTETLAPTAPLRRRASRAPLALALLALGVLGAGIAAAVLLARDGEEAGEAPPPTARTTPSATTVVRVVTQEGTTERVTVTAQPQPQPQPEPPPTEGGGLSVAQARALQDQSTAEMERGNWDRALALAQQALASLRGRDRTYEAYANFNIGNSLAHLGRCDEALPYLQRREEMLGPHSAVDAARRRCEE